MTETEEPTYRAYHRADPAHVSVRETDDGGMFEVRMPIASTGTVRNEGEEPLSRDELDGMAEQVNGGDVGVFLAHGRAPDISAARYSPTERLGTWRDAEVESPKDDERADDLIDEDLLYSTAVMPDPEGLPAETGAYRETLSILKAQAERDIPLSASIGWREDEDSPGGNDLMEASIVGIPADPRTTSQDAVAVMARAAVDSGADPQQFMERVRSVVMEPADRDPDQRHLSEQQAETARVIIDAYRDRQGDGSVENFEAWLFNVAWYEFDEDQVHATQTALQEWFRESSPLDEPVSERLIPFLDGRQEGEQTNDMTESETDEPDEESGADDGEQTERDDAPEWVNTLLENQQTIAESIQDLADNLRPDDDEDDDEDDEDGDEDDESASDEPDEEQSGEADEVRELREHLDALREGGIDVSDVEVPDEGPDEQASADADPADPYNKYGLKPTN